MLWNKTLIPTLKEAPQDAEVISHKLMIRSGLIRKLSSGTYTYLPLGLKVLKKIESIIREEMDRAGAIEVLMPALQPKDVWESSGRYAVFGPDLMKFKDRHGRDNILGPTHEEVITDLARREIHSYKQLPIILYQMQTKFRDEMRPRSGVIRAREFLMKDAYSFHKNSESLDKTYEKMRETYKIIFKRCGVTAHTVKADPGAMGGSGSQEFVLFSDAGEDKVAQIGKGGDVVAPEMISRQLEGLQLPNANNSSEFKKIHTPDIRTIEDVSSFLKKEPKDCLKAICYQNQEKSGPENFIIVLVRGDHEVSDYKVKKVHPGYQVASEVDIESANLPIGFVGPLGYKGRLLIDEDVLKMKDFVAGANEKDYHYTDLNLSDFAQDAKDITIGDYRVTCQGDLTDAGEALTFKTAIELGHIFKLKDRYSRSMGAKFLGEDGKEGVFEMGCYGIGVSRLLAACIEEHHDERGIIWPIDIAPYQIVITTVFDKEGKASRVSSEFYEKLKNTGYEVIWDNRDERPGLKFKDAELIGFPLRVVISPKNLEKNQIELYIRKTDKSIFVDIKNAIDEIRKHISE